MVMLLTVTSQVFAQKYISNASEITFFSEAPLENIEAVNTKSSSVFDFSSGDIVFSVPIREFMFQKSLMKKHFNENYMDSEKYPKSTFKGKISGYGMGDGIYPSKATGDLTIHGRTRPVEIDGEVEKQGGKLILKAAFLVELKDYNIKIPRILFSNIAESVEVNIEFIYMPYASN